jgi:hypothetical protein
MVLTNYRIVFLPSRKTSTDEHYHCRYDTPPFFGLITVPLGAISKITAASSPKASIYICAKDYRTIRVTFSTPIPSTATSSYGSSISGGNSSSGSQLSPSLNSLSSSSSGSSGFGRAEHLVQTLQRMVFYTTNPSIANRGGGLGRPFAYHYKAAFAVDGWRYSNVLMDYERMGLTNCSEWKVSFDSRIEMLHCAYCMFATIIVHHAYPLSTPSSVDPYFGNSTSHFSFVTCTPMTTCLSHHNYARKLVPQVFDNTTGRLSDSYPSHVVLPAELSEGDLWTSSAYRSRQRLPVVTYRHTRDGSASSTGAVLTRSAQPLVGLTMKLCSADARLLNLYRLKGRTADPL